MATTGSDDTTPSFSMLRIVRERLHVHMYSMARVHGDGYARTGQDASYTANKKNLGRLA